jgi:hypothetical protein
MEPSATVSTNPMTDESWNAGDLNTLPQSERAPEKAKSMPVVRRSIPQHPGVDEKTWFDKLEAFVSALSVRDTFWHRICSLIWLPSAFFSGIRTRQISAEMFTAILPFRRFNRNFYRAMAGGALLANSEIAGGMYVFGVCGADYTVVCKNLEYSFLRPCLGPAIYKMTPREDLKALIASKGEFNVTLDLDVLQQVTKPGLRDRRVGKCVAIFHVTPKVHHKIKKLRQGA